MIQDFIVFLEVMILKMIQDFPTQDIKIPAMFQNITVIDKSCLKIVMIPSIDITNGFQIVKRIVLGIQITTLAGTLIILRYPGFSEDGYQNCRVSQDDFFYVWKALSITMWFWHSWSFRLQTCRTKAALWVLGTCSTLDNYRGIPKICDWKKGLVLVENLHFWSNSSHILPTLPTQGVIILTKFHNLWTKTMDFLLTAKFWPSRIFWEYPFRLKAIKTAI